MKDNKPEQRFLDAGIYEKIVIANNVFYQRDFARLKPIAEEFVRLVLYYSKIERLKKIHGLSRFTQNLSEQERRSYWSTRLRQANEYLTEHSQLLSKNEAELILEDLSDTDLLECLNGSMEDCFKRTSVYDALIQFKFEQGLVDYLEGRLNDKGAKKPGRPKVTYKLDDIFTNANEKQYFKDLMEVFNKKFPTWENMDSNKPQRTMQALCIHLREKKIGLHLNFKPMVISIAEILDIHVDFAKGNLREDAHSNELADFELCERHLGK